MINNDYGRLNNGVGGDIITLKHNDKIIINGRHGIVGTVAGFATQYTGVSAKYNENPKDAINRAIARHEKLYWINQDASCLCGDKGYYEAWRKEWENAINLEDAQIVKIDDVLLKVHYKGNYSDMCNFIEVK